MSALSDVETKPRTEPMKWRSGTLVGLDFPGTWGHNPRHVAMKEELIEAFGAEDHGGPQVRWPRSAETLHKAKPGGGCVGLTGGCTACLLSMVSEG